MTPPDTPMPWGYPITADPAAIPVYRKGVRTLVDGRFPLAQGLLHRAVAIDDGFALAWAALAVVLVRTGEARAAAHAITRALDAGAHASRPERHHITTVNLALGPNRERATGLARDHLTDYPADTLVQMVAAHGAATLVTRAKDLVAKDGRREPNRRAHPLADESFDRTFTSFGGT